MQGGPFSIPTPVPLPLPPMIEHLLLEQPWALAIPLLAAGLIVARILRRSARASRLSWLGAALLLASGPGVILLAMLVTTDRERMTSATRDLVAAVAKADSPRLERLLAPGCYLFTRFGFPGYNGGNQGMDRASILDQVPKTIHEYPIAEHSILETQALSRGPGVGSTQLLVKVVVQEGQSGYKLPVQSWWKMDWRRDSDGQWRATAIEALTDPAGGFR